MPTDPAILARIVAGKAHKGDVSRSVIGGAVADAVAGALGAGPDSALMSMLGPLGMLRNAAALAQGKPSPAPVMPFSGALQGVADRIAPPPKRGVIYVTKRAETSDDSPAFQAALGWSLSQDAGGLRFETQDDALHYADELVERSRRRLALEHFNLTDHYKKSGCDLCLVVAVQADAGDFKLIARAVPDAGTQLASTGAGVDGEGLSGVDQEGVMRRTDGQDTLMFVRARHAAESPEFIIPSKVWLELPYEGDEVQVRALKLASDLPLQVVGSTSHREVDVAHRGESETGGAVAGGLIEGVSQMIHNAICGEPELHRETLEARAYDLLLGLTVYATDNLVTWCLNEGRGSGLEIRNAFFRAFEE